MISFVANTIQVHIACKHPSTGQILFLALKRSSGNPIYPGLWQAVTGTIEAGETAIECALREVEEETGLKPKEIWTIPFVGTFFRPIPEFRKCNTRFRRFSGLSGGNKDFLGAYRICLAFTRRIYRASSIAFAQTRRPILLGIHPPLSSTGYVQIQDVRRIFGQAITQDNPTNI